MKDTRPNGRVRQITSRGKVAPMCSCARRGSTNSVRREAKFASPIKAITPVQSRREKYFYFSFSEIVISLRHPASMRGALRDRHERWVRDAVGASTLQRDLTRTNSVDARGQVVWSRHPGADACATRRVSVVAWGQESRSPGRARSSRSNHRAGKAGRFRLHLWFCRVRFCCTRTMGASRRPVFPIGVKVARASIDTCVFEEAREGGAPTRVFCGASNGWLVVE